MKRFKVVTASKATEYWTYFIEAESEAEAQEKAESGDLDPDDYEVIGDQTAIQKVISVEEEEEV